MDLPKWIAVALAALWPGFGDEGPRSFNGYLEGDYLYPAASAGGRIDVVSVVEGQTVAAGDELFRLETDHQRLALAAAEAKAAAARATLEDLSTGAREAEIEVARASLAKAVADRDLARSNLDRSTRLLGSGSVTEVKVENDRTALAVAEAQVAQLTAQLHVAEMPARSGQRLAAEANLHAAEAEADSARRTLKDQIVTAPDAGLIEKLYYAKGEVVGAGTPVLRLLPPYRMKAIFFVPEPDRAAFHPGSKLALACTGCPPDLSLTVTRVADDPQYTPPIIYSETERARLVFRVEGRVDGVTPLLPGQPITVTPQP